MKKLLVTIALTLFASSVASAQEPKILSEGLEPPPAQVPFRESFRQGWGMGGSGMGMRRPGLGKWWKNPELAQELGLTDDQISQMEKIFQDHRLKLIDLKAALEKQEALLEPMVEADHPDESQVLAQIDKVAQARAELEKANARMLLGIRRVLTPEQWKKLEAEREMIHHPRMERERFRGPAAPPAPPTPPASSEPPGQ